MSSENQEHDHEGETQTKIEEIAPSRESQAIEEREEDALFKARAKLYRYDKETSQWKERGTGEVKFLRHKQTKKIRILMRRDKTLKICANHFVVPGMKIEENPGSDKAWMYNCPADFADEEPKKEMFAIRFTSTDIAKKFREHFESSLAEMKTILAQETKPEEAKAAPSAESASQNPTAETKLPAEEKKE